MSIYRSYFKKNNTIISNNKTNNGLNPVTDISYGTSDKQVSRFIFDFDFDGLLNKINGGLINVNNISKHTLHLTNTIRHSDANINKYRNFHTIKRASSFSLDLFKITEDWDEGNGYQFIYDDKYFPNNEQSSNWYSNKTNSLWAAEGIYVSGTTEIIETIDFDKGNENIEIDITDYVNDRLLNISGSTGLGIKFSDVFEEKSTTFREVVSFYTRNTNTFFAPYVETIINDEIYDDRNCFYLDKSNKLFLKTEDDGVVTKVEIFDYKNVLYDTLSGNSITKVRNGLFFINLNIDSSIYPDSVLFTDVWYVTINNKTQIHKNKIYLIQEENSSRVDFNNYYFNYSGIKQNEKISRGVIKEILINNRELYSNQKNNKLINIEYRIFVKLANDIEIDIIPYSIVNRIDDRNIIWLDTTWMIPQDYCLEILMVYGNLSQKKETLNFTIKN